MTRTGAEGFYRSAPDSRGDDKPLMRVCALDSLDADRAHTLHPEKTSRGDAAGYQANFWEEIYEELDA